MKLLEFSFASWNPAYFGLVNMKKKKFGFGVFLLLQPSRINKRTDKQAGKQTDK